MAVDFINLRNAGLGNIVKPFPNRPEVIAFWATKGWLPVDPNVPVPVYDTALDQGVGGLLGITTSATSVAARAASVSAVALSLAANPDSLIAGAITRDGNGAATAAPVLWPDGTAGLYTATTVSTAFPGAVDAYTITYGSPATKTYTQAAVTRDANGAVTQRPALAVS